MRKLISASLAVASLAMPVSAPAFAYPAGQDPVIAFSTVGRIAPGDSVSIQISRVKKDCAVTVEWAETDEVPAVTKFVKSTGKTGVITIATPKTAGTYTLTSSISKECAGDSSVTLEKSVVVGKLASIVGKITSSSAFAAKNPVLAVTGTIKSGSVAVANRSIVVKLKKGGEVIKTQSGTTNGSGGYTIAFSGVSYTVGAYTVDVELSSGSLYGKTVKTTAPLNLH
ncbi:MAG: hypothetical protein EBT07_08915 [Actinobacteria bacterium]|nr:hypothetical protein [Actinomycetota bacterium]